MDQKEEKFQINLLNPLLKGGGGNGEVLECDREADLRKHVGERIFKGTGCTPSPTFQIPRKVLSNHWPGPAFCPLWGS
jgi:hypothetical protein